MDPSAMDFVMHRSPSEPSRLLSDPMPQHHSPCPAMRAAAAATSASEQNQSPGLGASSRMSGRPHYDPVHGNTSSGGWWQRYPDQPQPQPQQHQYSHQHQAMPHLGWPPALYPPFARTNAPLYATNFAPVPSPGMPNAGPGNPSHIPRLHGHENFNGHAHPLSQMHSPPAFHHPPTITSLNRIGGSAPAHHSQGFSTQGSNPDSHVPRTSGLPALHPFSSMAHNQTSHSAQTFGNNNSSDMDATLRTRSDLGEQSRGNAEAARFSHEDARVTMGFRRQQPQPHQPPSPPMGDLPVLEATPATSNRPRFQPSSSEPSSDEDTDPEQDAQTLRFLEAVASTTNGIGFMPQYMGSEERLRAQQLIRGTVSGKRVASKSTIASLQSVEMSELTDSERSCIICYNEFGVENPEGVNEAPLRLPKCKHIFGDHCIKKWFEESDSCPYCRDKVPSEPQFHHGRPHSNQAMMHLVRQQHHGFAMSQALGGHRQARGDPGSRNRPGDPPRVNSLNFTDLYEQPPIFRRSDGSSFRSSWQSSPGRRSPSADFNEGRRRTRARHGSFRGSPPSTRPMSYTATSGGPIPPHFARPYGNSNLGRHSVQFPSASARAPDTPAFELNTPPTYPGPDAGGHHPSRGSSDAANGGTYPLRSDWRAPWGYQHPDSDETPDSRAPFQQSP
ncbi:ring finger domain-containing protein [Apiospora kogelbergensis]|uniref:Ring finger domain-containing protein n=1 Tax=Apiospora kogelbergensis TaxID=1337665 RepID=A0AAW0QWI7_9PEZI